MKWYNEYPSQIYIYLSNLILVGQNKFLPWKEMSLEGSLENYKLPWYRDSQFICEISE